MSRFAPLWALVLVIATLASLGLVTAPSAGAATTGASASATKDPTVRHGASQPIYNYSKAIREHVTVVSSMDSDGDGVADRIAVDIVRPSEKAALASKVPVIMEASPYYSCCGRGNEEQTKGYASNGTVDAMPLYYDNYFEPRGYAFVAVDLTGTNESTGCPDVGGPAEIAGAKAVIDWLNGRATAYDATGAPVTASWTNGKVGMIGKSWDGSIANGVAATGVAGLQTIVPISSISSWYDYERFNGVVRSTGYPTYLANYVSGRPSSVCSSVISANQATADDSTGNLNAYWDARNYRASVANVHASVFVVHGLNDLNVTTNQFASWWSALAAQGTPRKIWLSQDGHVDPFDYRRSVWVTTLGAWFDYWLKGVQNGIMSQPQADIQQASGTWTTDTTWPDAAAAPQTVTLGSGNGTTGTLDGPAGGTDTIVDQPNLTESQAVANPNSAVAGRAIFLSSALTSPLRISGSPSVTLRVQVSKPTTELTAKLVDYGNQTRVDYQSAGSGISTGTTRSCWGSSTSTDSACYLDTSQDMVTTSTDVLARGWQDAAHYQSLRTTTPLTPGTWYTITVPIDAHDDLIAAGHTLGLVLTLSDRQYTAPSSTGATVTIDLANSSLSLPDVNAGLPTTSAAPAVYAPAASLQSMQPGRLTPGY